MQYRKMIKIICEEEKIDFKLLSEDWIIALTKNNITKYITGYKFPLNEHSLGNIIDDKFGLYELCVLHNIKSIPHQILFRFNSKRGLNTKKLAIKYFNLYNKNVILKPNNGSLGNGVYHITNVNDLEPILNKLFLNNYSISICPFFYIESEYRVIVLNGKVKLTYEKIKPIIVGDGIHSIKELLIKFNPYYFRNKLNALEYNRILKNNERFEHDFRFNLNKGAIAKNVENPVLNKKISDFALNVTNKIGANFVSVDIVRCNNELYLLEVNSGVCINKVCNFIDKDYKIAKSIYKEAILKMFEND